MPVVMPVEHYDLWLDPGFKNTADLREPLHPFEAGVMRRYPVSTRVNLMKSDDPECARELKGQVVTV
jgi:putative SOS response-associated peptidase YedK